METKTLVAYLFLIPSFVGFVLVIIARSKFALDSAPGLMTTGPSFFKKSKAWYRPPGFALHVVGVTLIYFAIFENAIYSLFELLK